MNLFQTGEFTLHSGTKSKFKIDCDALTESDWLTLAKLVNDKFGPYRRAVGIPRGGAVFAQWLDLYRTDYPGDKLLVVDDVLTTGKSMLDEMAKYSGDTVGLVLFARGPLPENVNAIFSLWEVLR